MLPNRGRGLKHFIFGRASLSLVTSYEDKEEKQEAGPKIIPIGRSLEEHGIKLNVTICDTLHDLRIELDNGWIITLGRGLDFFQRPEDWLEIGANELNLRQGKETTVPSVCPCAGRAR